MRLLTPVFLFGYLAGIAGLVAFDIFVLGVGDPKFRTSIFFDFSISSVLFSPALVAGFVFLRRSKLVGGSLWQLGAIYLASVLVAVELPLLIDADGPLLLAILLLEYLLLGVIFWRSQRLRFST